MASHPHKSHTKEYIIIFLILTFLTVIELFVPSMEGASQMTKGLILTAMAVAKAFLVAYYFMHLKDEKKSLIFIAAIPLVAAVFAIVLMLENIYR